ncbi:MAG: cell division protein FtsL [Alphaproteobacteria bacterium]|nr:MAG: cell division protein FtsL [Alphaproteobacteria bacterium]
MRALVYLSSLLAVMGLAFWAYQESYRTREALAEVEGLRRDIARLAAELEVLSDEWAYLNRPDRLRELADINFDRLGLLPMTAAQFGRVDEIAYPTTPLVPLGAVLDGVEVMGRLEEEEGR